MRIPPFRHAIGTIGNYDDKDGNHRLAFEIQRVWHAHDHTGVKVWAEKKLCKFKTRDADDNIIVTTATNTEICSNLVNGLPPRRKS